MSLCGEKLEKRTDKNGNPYFVCDSCGIQLFIRRKQWRKLLEEAFHNCEKTQLPFTVQARNLYQIQALIKEIDGVKQEIGKVGHFFLDDEESRVREALKTKLKRLLAQLERIARGETGT